jgi:hypothetical protein
VNLSEIGMKLKTRMKTRMKSEYVTYVVKIMQEMKTT